MLLVMGIGGMSSTAYWAFEWFYPEIKQPKPSSSHFEDATGVRLVRVAVTAGGGMIDLRYQAVNPDKALIVHDRDSPPRIIDEKTGTVVARPWMDHSHDNELHTAVTYYQLLMNPAGVIKRGNEVTVAIGDAKLENIIVQ